MIAIVPALAALIGIVLYAISANGKVQEVGRALFWAGIFVVLLTLSGQSVKLF